MNYSSRKDKVKALILERQKANGKTDAQMAAILGISRQTYSRMINHQHTDEWELWKIRKLMWALNVTQSEFSASLTA